MEWWRNPAVVREEFRREMPPIAAVGLDHMYLMDPSLAMARFDHEAAANIMVASLFQRRTKYPHGWRFKCNDGRPEIGKPSSANSMTS
jgi:hypothetical protein